MKSFVLTILLLISAVNALELVEEAYPSLETLACEARSGTATVQKKIIDITHEMRPDLPSFANMPTTDPVKLLMSMRDERYNYNWSELKLMVHTGTHVDAPGHFVNEMYEAGFDVNSLDLNILVGPVLIVDVPQGDGHITEQVMRKLNIPRGVERDIFKTANTYKHEGKSKYIGFRGGGFEGGTVFDFGRLMYKPEFDEDYIGFTKEGAEWLVENTDIKLVGIDYLSVAVYTDLTGPHRAFLLQKLILVEGLKLDEVDVGLSTLFCLPLRLLKAEGCPARCILVN